MYKTLAVALLLGLFAFPVSAATYSCYYDNADGTPAVVDKLTVIVIGKVQFEVAPYHYNADGGTNPSVVWNNFIAGEVLFGRRLNGPRKCWSSRMQFNGDAAHFDVE